MKFTLEHAIILILAVALIYYVIQHRNLLTDLFRIPDRGHPELKAVKDKHDVNWCCDTGLFFCLPYSC
jgi:hypothetical protein